jgi:hypothetical protein
MPGYDVYLHTTPTEGTTPLNPESPPREAATNTARIAIKKTSMLAYGKLLANQTINTVAQELKADGNERLALTVSNLTNAANIAVSVIATQGLSLIPLTISSIASQVTRHRQAARETRIAEVETRLKGGRSNFNQGRVYFD